VVNNEFEQRRQTVASGLAEHKLDGLLVSWGPNLRYLSGFTGSNALLLLTAVRSILFTDPRYTIQAHRNPPARCTSAKGPLVLDMVAAIAGCACGAWATNPP
jgi:Xaa-Pro aminopeptidase